MKGLMPFFKLSPSCLVAGQGIGRLGSLVDRPELVLRGWFLSCPIKAYVIQSGLVNCIEQGQVLRSVPDLDHSTSLESTRSGSCRPSTL